MNAQLKSMGVTLLRLVGLYIAVLVLAGLLAPLFYVLIHPYMPRWAFEKYFDRIRYVGLLLMLPIVWRWCWGPGVGAMAGLRQMGWGAYRTGLLYALAGMASVVGLGLVLGGGRLSFDMAVVLPLLVAGLGVGLTVALIEEVVFRGLLQRMLVRGCGAPVGVMVGALCFAWLHGRPSVAGVVSGTPGVDDGLRLAWVYLTGAPANLPPLALVNLTLLGVALGVLYQRSGCLTTAIGLHAGIVAMVLPVAAMLGGVQGGSTAALGLVATPQASVMLLGWVLLTLVIRHKNKP